MNDRDIYWQKHINLYLTEKSGVTQKRFCEQNSLPKHRFKYHYRRLHLKTINNKSRLKPKPTKLKLAPVNITPDDNNKGARPLGNGFCTIHLPNGTYINLHDAQLVERYLSRSIGLC